MFPGRLGDNGANIRRGFFTPIPRFWRPIMDEDAKKTALRMIPYGMYVLTSKSKDGKDVSAATVNWLT